MKIKEKKKRAPKVYPSKKQTIGCLEVQEVEPGKWKVFNSINKVEHFTYGKSREVKANLKIQSQQWLERLGKFIQPNFAYKSKGKPGAAIRAHTDMSVKLTNMAKEAFRAKKAEGYESDRRKLVATPKYNKMPTRKAKTDELPFSFEE